MEPLVPSGAIEVVTRTCFSLEPAFGPLAARNRLLNIYEDLWELHLAGVASGVNKPQDAVRLLLDTASISQEASTSAAHIDDTVTPPPQPFAAHAAMRMAQRARLTLLSASWLVRSRSRASVAARSECIDPETSLRRCLHSLTSAASHS